jgi:hypothetical protein
LAQTKARAAQTHTYSRQLTLATIPVNEEVPSMPGKTTSKTGKVRLQLTFDRPFYNAGGEFSGRLEIQCSSSQSVRLADISIELLGLEGKVAKYPEMPSHDMFLFSCPYFFTHD